MAIEVISSTDTPETVQSVNGVEKVEAKADEQKSAPAEAEQKDESESGTDEVEAHGDNDKDESDKADAEDAEAKSDDSENEKPKKKGGFQRRIDKLNARVSAKEQEVEYWRSMAMKGAGEKKSEQVQAKTEPSGKPIPDNFDTHAEYVEALTDWKVAEKAKEMLAEQRKEALKTEQQRVLQAHHERVKSFTEKTTDFNEALMDVDDIVPSLTVEESILSSEHGPALMYELAKNREDYERINALPPIAAARELGKLEARIAAKAEASKKPEAKKITKAPAPVSPVGSKGGSVEKSIYDSDISQDEYERIRAKQRSA